MRDAPQSGPTDRSPRVAPVSREMAVRPGEAVRCCLARANRSRRLTRRRRREIEGERRLVLVGIPTLVIGPATMAFVPGVGLLSLTLRRECG